MPTSPLPPLISRVRVACLPLTVLPPAPLVGHARHLLVRQEPRQGVPALRLLRKEVLPTTAPAIAPKTHARRYVTPSHHFCTSAKIIIKMLQSLFIDFENHPTQQQQSCTKAHSTQQYTYLLFLYSMHANLYDIRLYYDTAYIDTRHQGTVFQIIAIPRY